MSNFNRNVFLFFVNKGKQLNNSKFDQNMIYNILLNNTYLLKLFRSYEKI